MNIDFDVKRVNNIKLKPIIDNKALNDTKNIVGSELFPNPYSNTFILAKKRSGKTNTIFHILKHSVYKDCKVIFFVSSIHTDKTYKEILKMLDRKNIEYEAYNDFIDSENNDDILANLVEELKEPDEDSSDDDDNDVEEKVIPIYQKGINFGSTRIIKKKRREQAQKKKKPNKKPKKLYSKIILVIDDLGASCRNKNIIQILKTNRHSKLRVIISSQFITDLHPSALKQLDYCLVFKSLNKEKIETLREHLDISNLSTEEFVDVYQSVTEEPYSFLYIDVRNEKYRKNFDVEINVIKNDKIE